MFTDKHVEDRNMSIMQGNTLVVQHSAVNEATGRALVRQNPYYRMLFEVMTRPVSREFMCSYLLKPEYQQATLLFLYLYIEIRTAYPNIGDFEVLGYVDSIVKNSKTRQFCTSTLLNNVFQTRRNEIKRTIITTDGIDGMPTTVSPCVD